MITVVVGGIGNSKTLTSVFNALISKTNEYKIISNCVLNFGRDFYVNSYDDIKNKIKEMAEGEDYYHFLLDEGWMYFDSRNASSDNNVKWSGLILQSRKAYCNIEITAQDMGQIDKRIRRVVDKILLPQVLVWSGEPMRSIPLLVQVESMVKNKLTGALMYERPLLLPVPYWLAMQYNTREIIEPVLVKSKTEIAKEERENRKLEKTAFEI